MPYFHRVGYGGALLAFCSEKRGELYAYYLNTTPLRSALICFENCTCTLLEYYSNESIQQLVKHVRSR
jgi:hypothetical protein